MKNRRKNLVITLLPFIMIPVIVTGSYIYMQYLKIYIFPCPAWIMGFFCPGCGGTRCISSLLQGDILSALKYNALVIIGLILLLLYWLENLISLFGKNIKIIPKNRSFLIAFSGIVIIYTILRNIFPILAPV